jgi:hypothetical protein
MSISYIALLINNHNAPQRAHEVKIIQQGLNMFDKLACEKCGKEYRVKTISENRGKHLCKDCISHCSTCGAKLPMANWYGQTGSVTGAFLGPVAGSLHDSRRPAIGSGKCNACFWKEQEAKQA